MAEVLGIVAGVTGLLDTCTRLTVYIKELKEDGAGLYATLDGLLTEVTALGQAYRAVETVYKNHATTLQTTIEPRHKRPLSLADTKKTWTALEKAIKSCDTITAELCSILEKISQSKRIVLRVRAFWSKTEEIRQRRTQLVMYNDVIQMYLTLLEG